MSTKNAKFGEKSMDSATKFALWMKEYSHVLAAWGKIVLA